MQTTLYTNKTTPPPTTIKIPRKTHEKNQIHKNHPQKMDTKRNTIHEQTNKTRIHNKTNQPSTKPQQHKRSNQKKKTNQKTTNTKTIQQKTLPRKTRKQQPIPTIHTTKKRTRPIQRRKQTIHKLQSHNQRHRQNNKLHLPPRRI